MNPPSAPPANTTAHGGQARKYPRLTLYRILFLFATMGFGVIELVVALCGARNNADALLDCMYNLVFTSLLFWLGLFEHECPQTMRWLFTDVSEMFAGSKAYPHGRFIMLGRSIPPDVEQALEWSAYTDEDAPSAAGAFKMEPLSSATPDYGSIASTSIAPPGLLIQISPARPTPTPQIALPFPGTTKKKKAGKKPKIRCPFCERLFKKKKGCAQHCRAKHRPKAANA
ncbi:hypothetical protein MKEN_00719800 [Mycena kentingensis (nom. inval.)]|nr:hypothetical protein MKEN_00719800 [Mycena kentingensis (nom. inval.)]